MTVFTANTVLLHYSIRKDIAAAILHLCECITKTDREENQTWMAALPLYHFLNEDCQPFEKLERRPGKISWELSEKRVLVRSR